MPTEISHAVRMHAISGFHSSLTVRLLNKGPEYLRRQMEAGTPGRKSAVERLAADKAKYVKSQQVISTNQEPVTVLSSSSESSSESCSVEAKKVVSKNLGEGERVHAGDSGPLALEHGLPIVRRSSAKRQIRPDSLVIYRQKCEFVRGQCNESARGSLVRRLFQGSFKEKQLAPEASKIILKEDIAPETGRAGLTEDASNKPDVAGQNTSPNTSPTAVLTSRCENASNLTTVPYEVKEVRRRGLHRSQSDISSRYSKSFSEFDTFFKYCGLDPEVIEDLGQENFSVASDNVSFRIRSISVATSESDFTRHSGDDGLLEEELTEQVPTGTSVIERNARIIKWLYTCKKAKETNKVLQEFA
ncbi:protein FAM110C [Hemicordylus capensis]|uniref:protein FAM110C n=1 Tax=Hemicordylus capensis TaxID=884348 RepID=UPI0023033F73|nr:protein FAM110C [Hemicordylus capensis]XP_053150435.1 protein FAM110C [Hemicordylus capensis]XP_053150442.1 protein FAM110C [Hemicordylus capensis]